MAYRTCKGLSLHRLIYLVLLGSHQELFADSLLFIAHQENDRFSSTKSFLDPFEAKVFMWYVPITELLILLIALFTVVVLFLQLEDYLA